MFQTGIRIGAAAFAVLIVAACNQTTATAPAAAPTPNPVISYAPAELRDLTADEKQALGASLAKGLKDPESARFTWLKVPRNAGDSFDYCAMVNAKNSYGGYTGSKPFMAVVLVKNGKIVGGVLGLVGSDKFANDFIRSDCQKKGFDPYLAV